MMSERLMLRSASRHLPSPFLGTLVALALCGFAPILLMAATPTPALEAWPLALVSTLISGARFAWAIAGPSRRLYEMTTWLFLYLFLGLAPLVQLRQGLDPSTTPNIFHQYDVTALGIVLIFEVALIFGSFLSRRQDLDAVDVIPQRFTRPVHRTRLLLATAVLLALSVFYIVRVGPASIWASRVDRGTAAAEGIGDDVLNTILTALVSLGLLVAVVALAQDRREERARGRQTGLLLIVFSAIVLLFLVNPIGSPRFVLVTVYLGLLAAAGVFRRARSFRAISIGSIAAMFLVFPILDTFRFSTANTAQLATPVTSLGRGDYDSYAQIVNTAWYVDLGGVTWGNQLLGVLFFWIPRGLWPAKPEDTGIFLAGQRGYLFGNLSAPLPAELFINFGWVGVIVGGALLGALLRRLDASSEMHLRTIGTPTILGSIVPFYMILLLRGSLLQAAANLAVMLFVWWFVTRPRPKNRALLRSSTERTFIARARATLSGPGG